MAINRYDTPAQAEFINTYVPIPFEQLYTLGRDAKAEVDKAIAEQSSALSKWSEFRSPSAVDTAAWNEATLGAVKPVIDKLAANPDLIKTVEGRSMLRSAINNVDTNKLSLLQQSRDNLLQRQAIDQELMIKGKYNPEWHALDYGNYNTLNKGIFNDLTPLAYQSIQELTDPYFSGIKDTFLGKDKTGLYNRTGVTKDIIANIADENLSGIMVTPVAQKHMELYMKQTGANEEQAKAWLRDKVIQDNLRYVRENIEADPYALLNAKTNADIATARARSGATASGVLGLKDTMNYTGAKVISESFSKGIDTFMNIAQNLKPSIYKEAAPYTDKMTKLSEAYNALAANPNTPIDQLEAISKEFEKTEAEFAKKYGREVYKSIFMSNSAGQDPEVASGKNFSSENYLNGMNHLIDQNTWTLGAQTVNEDLIPNMSGVKKTSYTTEDGTTYNAYAMSDTKSLRLPETFGNLMMGLKKGRDQDVDGKNFALDFETGKIKNVITEPSGNIVTHYDTNGKITHSLEVSVKIPKSSLDRLGYDERSLGARIGVGITGGAGAGAIVGGPIGAGVGAIAGGLYGAGTYAIGDSRNTELEHKFGLTKMGVKSGDDIVEYYEVKAYQPVPDNKAVNDVINLSYVGRIGNSTLRAQQVPNFQLNDR